MLVIEEGRLGFTPALWVRLRLAMVQPVLRPSARSHRCGLAAEVAAPLYLVLTVWALMMFVLFSEMLSPVHVVGIVEAAGGDDREPG
jgi:hypothetical protein